MKVDTLEPYGGYIVVVWKSKENYVNEYEALREAIIIQAAKDWESLCNGEPETRQCNFKELASFFLSDCNDMLCNTALSGERILHKLMKMRGAPKWSEIRAVK